MKHSGCRAAGYRRAWDDDLYGCRTEPCAAGRSADDQQETQEDTVKLKDGRLADVEMQKARQDFIFSRMEV